MPNRLLAALVTSAMLGACSGARSPAGPTPPPSGDSTVATTGQIVGVLDGAAIAGVAVRANGAPETTSDGNGFFTVNEPQPGRYGIVFSGGGVVERQTGLTVPGVHVTLPLIPGQFDLGAFDQMFRHAGQLLRWTTAPALIVQRRVLTFTSGNDREFDAESELVSDAEVSGLADDLTAVLAPFTGGRFPGFASVTPETANPGARVSVQRIGAVVVARYRGLLATGQLGLGQWGFQPDGTVRAGIVMLDRDFDGTPSGHRRTVRIHELGHALGYDHVSSRASVMNQDGRTDITDFDRQAAVIAFNRPPGNRSPDTDPQNFSTNTQPDVVVAPLVWSGPVR